MLDRVEMSLENKRDKDLLEVSMPQPNDFGLKWQCSLRANDRDHKYDGIAHLKSTLDKHAKLKPTQDSIEA